MGLMQKLREQRDERARKAQARRSEELAAKAHAELAEWREEEGELLELIETAKEFRGMVPADVSMPVQVKKGERIFLVAEGVSLIEPRRLPGRYEGGYSGVSFRVAKGVRLHTGGSRGQYVQGAEVPTSIDIGTAVITDQRVIFAGAKYSREWAFSKLLAVQHQSDAPWTALSVSNRQKTSGILYGDEHAAGVRFRLALALAVFQESTDALIGSIEEALGAHRGAMPVLPASSSLSPPSDTSDSSPR